MAIIAQFQGKAVEVIDVYSSGDGRKMAAIRALEGQSYWAWTHGGWAEYDTCTVPAGTLHPMEIVGAYCQISHATPAIIRLKWYSSTLGPATSAPWWTL